MKGEIINKNSNSRKNILIESGILLLLLTFHLLGAFYIGILTMFDCFIEIGYIYKISILKLAVITIMELYFILKKYKEQLKVFKFLVWIIYSIIPALLIFTSIVFISKYNKLYSPIDKEVLNSNYKPIKMIRTLYEDNYFENKSKNEIIELLGDPKIIKGKFIYNTQENLPLYIEFDKGKVKKVYIDCML